MTTKVARLSRVVVTESGQLVVDGKPACAKCGRRPKRPGRGRRKWQSYCDVCHAEDHAERRREQTQITINRADRGLVVAIRRAKLSAEERGAVMDVLIDTLVELRTAAAGRHHRSG